MADARKDAEVTFVVDARSGLPASQQLRAQIVDAVQSHALLPGATLPPVRRLAEQLGLAPNTVAKVYRELERDEIVVTRGRNGTSVAPTGDGPTRQAQLAALAFVARTRELGISDAESIDIVRRAFEA